MEATSDAAKHAKNLDDIITCAEATSQAEKIIALGESLPTHKLVGREGYLIVIAVLLCPSQRLD